MAFTCGFFNSENGDRKYNAEQMSAIFDGIIADGVFTTIGDHMAVSAGTGMQVLVGTGKAWFDHTWNVNDAAYPLTIAASDVTLSRIDAIVLETNHSDSVRLNKLRVVQGTVASSPAKPTLTNSEKVHQHPLAWVTVKPGVTKIDASAIENAVGTSACPFVTGIIATTAIDDLFNQWNGEFDEWFDNLKAQLSDNVVANLQRQIDARVKIADKATSDDITQGTNDSKWVTPKGLKDSNVGYQVGDIFTTARTNLGDKWALCNGTSIDPNQYPNIHSILYGETIDVSTSLNERNISSVNCGGVIVLPDNTYVMTIGGFYSSGGSTYPFYEMKYSSAPSNGWYDGSLSITPDTYGKLSYANGEMIISAGIKVNNAKKWAIYYNTSTVSPTAAWTNRIIGDRINNDSISNVVYFNGKYIFALMKYGNSQIAIYSSSSLAGTWSNVATISNIEAMASSLSIVNNQLALCVGINDYPSNAFGLIYSSNGTNWTTMKMPHASNINRVTGSAITYLNGSYIISGGTYTNSWQPAVFISTSLNGHWDAYNISSGIIDPIPAPVVYANGKYYIVAHKENSAKSILYTASSPAGPWTALSPYISERCYDMIADQRGNIIMATGHYVTTLGSWLPLISPDKSYAYIKVK